MGKIFGMVFGGFAAVLLVVFILGPTVMNTLRSTGVLEPKVIDEQTVRVTVSRYAYSSFQVFSDAQVRIEMDLVEGPAADARLLTDRHFEVLERSLKNGRSNVAVKPIEGLSQLGLDGPFDSGWISLEPGSYHLVINRKGKTGSAGRSEVSYKISVK